MLSKIQELPAVEIPVDDPRWELVQRVVASPEFQRATRLREFLQYVCQCALRSDPEGATEHQIGIHVFGCAPGYDSNVVRSQARQLRLKLESHFANSGSAEPVCIVIPKGSYLPEFRPRAPQPLIAVPDVLPSEKKEEKRIALGIPVLAAAAAALLLMGSAIGILIGRHSHVDARNQTPPASIVQALAPRPGQHLNIVMEDFGLHLLDALGVAATSSITLDDYANGTFLRPDRLPPGHAADSDVLRLLSRSNITGSYAMPVISRIFGSLPIDQIFVKHAREVTSRDFENDNSLLIGGPRVNPWVQMFEEKLKFRNEVYTPRGAIHIRNLAPLPGEQSVYVPDRTTGGELRPHRLYPKPHGNRYGHAGGRPQRARNGGLGGVHRRSVIAQGIAPHLRREDRPRLATV
jgi:hypothetical protein